MITETEIRGLYLGEKKSSAEIAKILNCSEHQINYWIDKYKIPKRSISEAIYLKHNPTGDPFIIKNKLTDEERELKGLGLGLYWGEGTKSNHFSIRIGNSDPFLIKRFIEFLKIVYGANENKLRFGLQIFSDIDPRKAFNFWLKYLKVKKSQFQKIIVTETRGNGTYKNKIKYGVLTLHYNNKKLRNIIIDELKKLGYKGL